MLEVVVVLKFWSRGFGELVTGSRTTTYICAVSKDTYIYRNLI